MLVHLPVAPPTLVAAQLAPLAVLAEILGFQCPGSFTLKPLWVITFEHVHTGQITGVMGPSVA